VRFMVHRKEQWDLECAPWVCIHLRRGNYSKRVFCLWRGGIQLGAWLWVWTKRHGAQAS
jgi:hypothetical protein